MAVSSPRRVVDPEEQLAFAHAVTRGFHHDATDEELSGWAQRLWEAPDQRAWIVTDADRIVGNLGVHATDLSLPGGTRIPVAAITAVGVAQTHRRRGLLSAMMAACLDEAVEQGEPVAALYPSEGAIYGRFGFGGSGPSLRYRLERVHAVFRDPVGLRVEAVAATEARAAFEPVFQALRARRAGVGRTDVQWYYALEDDPPGELGGASARRLVHVPGRGYATYRVKGSWDDALPAGSVAVEELLATDAEAEAALWQHVCDIDLTTTVTADHRPADGALPWLLRDPLRCATSPSLPLSTRILDVARALESRAYAAAGAVVLEVHAPDHHGGGRWLLETSPQGATCTATTRAPEIELPLEALSAIWLGGVAGTRLLDARLVTEHVGGSVARLDRMLASERGPWTPFVF